jgi:hypothetical protein
MVLKCDKQMPIQQAMKENGLLECEFNEFINPLITQDLIAIENENVKITQKTEDYLSKLWAVKDKAEEKILACLSTEEVVTFNNMLNRLLKNCEEIITMKAEDKF